MLFTTHMKMVCAACIAILFSLSVVRGFGTIGGLI